MSYCMSDLCPSDLTIVRAATQLAATSGAINAGLTVNSAAFNGQAKDIDVAAIIDAGDGSDFVQASDRGDNVFGGTGNDVLVGGKLDDWLLGGDGNDVLFAGRAANTGFAATDQAATDAALAVDGRSEEHTSELQSLMRSSYAVFCLKKK